MKIVYVYDSLAICGGLERIMIDKMNYLADRLGYEVYVITASQGNHTVKFPMSDNVTHIDLNLIMHDVYRYRYPMRLWKKYRKAILFRKRYQETIEKISPDIISCPVTFYPDTICKIKGKAKVVLESHNAKTMTYYDYMEIQSPLEKWMISKLLKRQLKKAEQLCDVLVALTNGDAQEWHYAKNVTVIPNFTLVSSNSLPQLDNHEVIAAGRLTMQKGFHFMIDAWKIVAERYPTWHLNIFGNGHYKERLQKQIDDMELNGNVTLHPATRNFPIELARNQFFVLSSVYEGFGLVLIEAMASGLPCVSFDCSYGPSDIIKDKEDGLLVENGNVDALAKGICWMIEHEDERKEMGRKAKENVKRFSPDIVMAQWDKLFRELAIGATSPNVHV